jgi:hypothetical protein
MPILTVEEMLMIEALSVSNGSGSNTEYTSMMKLPHTKSIKEKKQAVDRIIAKMNLEKCIDTVIGNSSNRGISGGQVWLVLPSIGNGASIVFSDPCC